MRKPADQSSWARLRQAFKSFFTSEASERRPMKAGVHEQRSRDIAETYDRKKRAVVQVRAPSGSGSGMVVGDGHLILTNRHVVEASPWVDVVSHGSTKGRAARVVFSDRRLDVALLYVEPPEPVKLEFSEQAIRPGMHVIAIGYPLNLSSNVTEGIISGVDPPSAENNRVEYYRTDAAINPGNSGGPLLTTDGFVVGMNTFGLTDAENINYALPLRYLRAAVEKTKPWNLSTRLYCPHCGHSAPEGKHCEVCGAPLHRYSPPEDGGGAQTVSEDKPSAAGRQAIHRGRAAIASALPQFVETLTSNGLDAQQTQIGDSTWRVETGLPGIGNFSVLLIICQHQPYLVVWSKFDDLPFDDLLSYYRELLEFNHPDKLGPAKISLVGDRVLLSHVRPADALDLNEVLRAIDAFVESRNILDEQADDLGPRPAGEEDSQEESDTQEESSGEKQGQGILEGLFGRFRNVFRRDTEPWEESKVAVAVEGVLRSADNVTAQREKITHSWVVTRGGCTMRFVLSYSGDEGWLLEATTPIMNCSTGNDLAFHRRLLEMNDPADTGAARLYLDQEKVQCGIRVELDDYGQVLQSIDDLTSTASRVVRSLEEFAAS